MKIVLKIWLIIAANCEHCYDKLFTTFARILINYFVEIGLRK